MEIKGDRWKPRRLHLICVKVVTLVFLSTSCSGQQADGVPAEVAPPGARVAPPVTDVAPPESDPLDVPAITYVRKCLCNATELLEQGACLEHPQLVKAVFASPFNISVRDLTCLPPLTQVLLSSEEFTPVEEGAIYVPLLDSFVPLSDHCIEYMYNLYGEMTMEAKVCIAGPQVPVCCTGGTPPLPDDGGGLSCGGMSHGEQPSTEAVPLGTGGVTLPVYVGSRPVDFGGLDTVVSPVTCVENKTLTMTSLSDTDEAAVGYAVGEAFLEWMTPNGKAHRLAHNEFCLGRTLAPDGEKFKAFFCYRNPLEDHNETCGGQVCVRKCCPPGSLYFDNIGCTEFPDPGGWIPPMHSHETLQPLDTPVPVVEVYGPPICAQVYALDADLPFVLLDDGQLTLLHGASYPPYRYCLDNMLSDNGTVTTIALLCFDDAASEGTCAWQGVVQTVALALSCAFILATLFVYVSVAEIFRRLPSKCVVCESAALLLSFLGLILLQALSAAPNSPFCVTIGLIFYYSTLASFFWLNVMCFDMFLTFRSVLREGGGQRKWLVRYSLYGWGLPLVFLVAVCVIDNLPFDAAFFHVVRPNIFTACHIPANDYVARWVYMYVPMLVLLAVNTSLFLYVAVVLVRQQRENASVLQGTDSQARAGGKGAQAGGKARESAVLCLKLFVVMGVTWVTEIVSFADGSPCYVWLVTDIINCLRGLFIFLIFVCKRDVIKKFKSTWGPRVPPSCRKCPSFGGGGATSRPKSHDVTDSVVSTSMWSSRKTSHTSLFGFPRRKTSTASGIVGGGAGGGECYKMATVTEHHGGDQAEK